MTIRLPLRFTESSTAAPAPLEAWNLDESSTDTPAELARTLVGVRPRGSGTVEIERVGAGAELVGHVVGEERVIPPFTWSPCTADTSAFGLDAPTTGGHVVLASAATQRLREIDPWFARRLPAIVGALCLPLSMVPMRAAASTSGSRKSPEVEETAEPEEAPAPEPAPEQESGLPDSTWTALTGKKVVLTKADGFALEGNLVAVDDENASVAVADGSVVVVPRASVTSVKLVPNEPPPKNDDDDDDDDEPESYVGMLVGGSIMVAVGGSIAIVGAALTGLYAAACTFTTTGGSITTCSGVSHPGFFAGVLLVPGLLMTGGGAAMLGVGVKRKKAAERRKAEITLMPRLQRNAWGGALQIRF